MRAVPQRPTTISRAASITSTFARCCVEDDRSSSRPARPQPVTTGQRRGRGYWFGHEGLAVPHSQRSRVPG
uniref:phage DNA packaging protein J n=1 Tax=Neorhodopirellula lusitana TaxID=445327 RepID=UPI00384BA10A